jgi:hypothetical protein
MIWKNIYGAGMKAPMLASIVKRKLASRETGLRRR